MWRAPVLLVVVSSVALADADDLVRRARTRFEHGNRDGAIALLERAVAEDPTCTPALALLAENAGSKPAPMLRYLEHGRPIAVPIARKCLADLAGLVGNLDEDLCERVERGTLIPVGGEIEGQGPWRPWQAPDLLEPAIPPFGPLRQEGLGTWAHAHRGALLGIEARFLIDGLDDAVCWARLAVLLRKCDDPAAARRCLERAHATGLDDRVRVARAALDACDDPYAWWRQNGEPLLVEISACGPLGPWDSERYQLFDRVSRVLYEHDDLVGLARLRIAELDTSSLGLSESPTTTQALLVLQRADVAYEAVRTLDEPGADLVRIDLLKIMGQYDLALELGETLVHRRPEYLPGWRRLGADAWSADLVSRSILCREVLFEAIVRNGRGDCGRLVGEYLDLLQRIGREDDVLDLVGRLADARGFEWHALAQVRKLPRGRTRALRERLLDRLTEFPLPYDSTLLWLASFAFDEGRPELGFELLRGVSEYPRNRFDGPFTPGYAIASMAEGVSRLQALAEALSPGFAADALLRQSCGWKGGERAASDLLVRIRCELEADRHFRRLPGASYVLSLLYDPRLQPDTVRALRRAAFDSGCRARGLLLDMAVDGEPVLDALAKVDPVAARLERALRAEGARELTEFLEDDEASSSQLQRARIALRARTRVWEGGADNAPERPSELWRRLAEAVRTHPVAARLEIQQLDEPRWDITELIFEAPAPPDTVDALLEEARRQPTSRDPWIQGALKVIEREGAPALDRLLDELGVDPLRPVLLAPAMDRDVAVRAVRRGRHRHPQDLRWTGVEVALTADPLLAEELRMARDAIPAWIRADGRADDASLRTYIDMRAPDPPVLVAGSVTHDLRQRPGQPIVAEVLGELWRRCRTDRERGALVPVARQTKEVALADGWDAMLRESADVDVRFEAVVRGREREPGPADMVQMRYLAEDPRWSDEQRCTLWTWAAEDAIKDTHGERLEQALLGIWQCGLLGARRGGSNDGAQIIDAMSLARGLLAQILEPRLREGDEAVPLWFFMAKSAPYVARGPDERADAFARCAAHGFVSAEAWESMAGADDPLEASRRLLDTLPPGQESFFGGSCILSAARRLALAGRVDEAAACLEAWAERCGPLTRGECQREGRGFERATFRLEPSPISIEECFKLVPQPPKARVAQWLDAWGRPAEAERWIRAALAEPWPEVVLAECRFMKACIEVRAVFPREEDSWMRTGTPASCIPDLASEAVWSLWELSHTATDLDLREKSYELLVRLYHEHPATRLAFVDRMLAEVDDAPPASDVDLQAWAARLGQPDVAQRASAEDDLRSRGRAALPLLRRLRSAADPEVAARAEAVLGDLAEP